MNKTTVQEPVIYCKFKIPARMFEIPWRNLTLTGDNYTTARVKDAQALGAGDYIKKPYTFEKLGFAVKNAFK